MIYINPTNASNAADKMIVQAKKIIGKTDEFESVKRTLSEMSGMEKIIAELEKIQRNIEKSGMTVHRMGTVIKEVSEIYRHCENDIMDYADNSKMVFKLGIRGVNDFTPIRNLISDLKFI